MTPAILYSKSSIKFLKKIDKKVAARITAGISGLPAEGDIKRLKGQELHDLYRLRIGKYRIIYSFDKDCIKILKIDSRGDIYK